MTMQIKSAQGLQIKELTEDGQIGGYGSTFGGEPDSYGDVVVKGAFESSLALHKAKGSMPKMFWQHNTNEPIGKWIEAHEDEKGLFLTGKLNMDVQRGREAHALLKAGDIDGLSIGYRIKKYEVDEESQIWYLKELDLFEVSPVSIPANENATVTSAKSARDAFALQERLANGDHLSTREFEKLLKGSLGLSNSQAERAVRLHLKGQGELAPTANDGGAFMRALISH